MVRKTHAYLFFALYFVLYALSPLTYSVHRRAGDASDLEPRNPAPQGFHILMWEIIVKKLADETGPRPESTEATILLMKKRGLLPEDDSLLREPAVSAVLKISSEAADNLVLGNVPELTVRNFHAGYHPLYAGHSPPLA